MKSFKPEDLVWGVTEIIGEENVLLVQSKSRAGIKHRVELEALAGFGCCGCEGFMSFGKMAKVEQALIDGKWPRLDLTCEHLRRGRQFFYLREIQKQIADRKKGVTHL